MYLTDFASFLYTRYYLFLNKLLLVFLYSFVNLFRKWRGNPYVSNASQFHGPVNAAHRRGRGHTFNEVFVLFCFVLFLSGQRGSS